MSDAEKVRVFISWSGEGAKKVATALRIAIDDCFDLVSPFMSDADIEGGQRGLRVIEEELNASQFGIIVVTKANMNATWLNFEAGAISKALHDDDTRVIPLLVDVPNASELAGPMAQFQARKADRKDLGLVFDQIGRAASIETDKVTRRLNGAWPMIEAAVSAARAVAGGEDAPRRTTESMVAEVLELVRGLRRDAEVLPESISRAARNEALHQRAQGPNSPLMLLLQRHGFTSKTAHVEPRLNGFLSVYLENGTSESAAENLRDDLERAGFEADVEIYPF